VPGHSTIGRRLAAVTLGLAAATALASCAVGFPGPAPDVSDQTAFIQGDVLSTRTEQGEAWFKWGTTNAYGNETPHGTVDFVAGIRQGHFGFLSGLDHHTTYHFALCADDQEPGLGPLCTGDQTFTTLGDDIRGPLLVLVGGSQIVTVSFQDVESGYHGESPRGFVSDSQTGAISAVTCLNVTGSQSFTVGLEQVAGAIYLLFYVDLSPGVNSITSELPASKPTTCPASPQPGTPINAAAPGTGFTINDG
jgi:hypothetical protein